WINAGYFVCEPKIFDYILNGDNTTFEQEPLKNLAKDGEIFTFQHNGFWKPMDSLKDKNDLNKLWNENKAPWKVWDK
ncbi:MAG: glucose-1-phosphate cytidylyltransferase, partial [Arcobacteraceae bacterium]|nr:glucose-1-phosphate cytidylyltransferase [Arcobacteraceae bacterium]